MLTISQHKENVRKLMVEADKIDAKCVAESRDMTAEEVNLKNDLFDEIEKINTIVKAMERQEKLAGVLTDTTAGPTAAPIPSVSASISDRPQDRFNSFGQQMAAIMVAGSPGGRVDPRLLNATGLSEGINSDGGFLVQQDFQSELLADVFETGILAQRCRRIQIGGNSNGTKIPGFDETSRASTRAGGVLAYWKAEGGAKTASKPAFREIDLNLQKLIGLCYATDELLQDATALESYIKKAFTDEFGFQVDDAIVRGTGAGMPLGILNGGSLVSVAKESGQNADTIVAENVINMYSRLFASSYRNAVWTINQDTLPQLLTMSVAVGTGGMPVYLPPGNSLSNAPGGTLLGLPVFPIEQASTVGTVGDIMLCDFANGYVLAEKGGIQADMSIHVQFIYDESVFRFVLRIDGQPTRASVLTPYKGGSTKTQSHFIALATRD